MTVGRARVRQAEVGWRPWGTRWYRSLGGNRGLLCNVAWMGIGKISFYVRTVLIFASYLIFGVNGSTWDMERTGFMTHDILKLSITIIPPKISC